jgi:hypothetical protein
MHVKLLGLGLVHENQTYFFVFEMKVYFKIFRFVF